MLNLLHVDLNERLPGVLYIPEIHYKQLLRKKSENIYLNAPAAVL